MTTVGGVPEVALVVTDLDGTLWDRSERTHPSTRAAWDAIERLGVPILVATGRRVGSAARPLAELGLRPPAVCLNGALGLDLADAQRFHRSTIAAPDALAVLAAFRAHGVQPCVYVDADDVAVCVDARPSTHPEHLASFGADVATADLEEVCRVASVLAFSVLGAPGDLAAAVAASIGSAGVPHLHVDPYYGGFSLTVAGPGMSKWDGVVAFCASRGIDPANVLAIGEGPNDTELLAAAAVAVVPQGSHAAALALADHVTAPAGAGGWAEIVGLL
jgi:hydroxymethylpyrimidine pyrophosphatase-like HAD family hydrolase